jgi:hypothetical protein
LLESGQKRDEELCHLDLLRTQHTPNTCAAEGILRLLQAHQASLEGLPSDPNHLHQDY